MLAFAVAVVIILFGVSVTVNPVLHLAVVGPFALVSFVVLGWKPFRMRGLTVTQHARGVVVATARERSSMVFDDVDELWFSLRHLRTYGGTIAFIREVRLVDRSGRSCLVPTSLGGASRIAGWLIGKFSLDRDGIRGPRWSAPWSDLSLVRFEEGKLFFFRRQRIVQWRSIGQDDVPHPTLFTAIVKDCAKTFEAEDRCGHEP